MKWGDAKTYAWLWSVSGPTYKNELLFWLETENPALHQLVMKEIAREDHVTPKTAQRAKQKAPSPGVSPEGQHDDPVQELGDDLLAGGG